MGPQGEQGERGLPGPVELVNTPIGRDNAGWLRNNFLPKILSKLSERITAFEERSIATTSAIVTTTAQPTSAIVTTTAQPTLLDLINDFIKKMIGDPVITNIVTLINNPNSTNDDFNTIVNNFYSNIYNRYSFENYKDQTLTIEEQISIFKKLYNIGDSWSLDNKKFLNIDSDKRLIALLLFYKIFSKQGILTNFIYTTPSNDILPLNFSNMISTSKRKFTEDNLSIYFGFLQRVNVDNGTYDKMLGIPNNSVYLAIPTETDEDTIKRSRIIKKILLYFNNLTL